MVSFGNVCCLLYCIHPKASWRREDGEGEGLVQWGEGR